MKVKKKVTTPTLPSYSAA